MVEAFTALAQLSWRDDWISNNIYFQSWALGVSGWIVALAFGDWWSARDHINYVEARPDKWVVSG